MESEYGTVWEASILVELSAPASYSSTYKEETNQSTAAWCNSKMEGTDNSKSELASMSCNHVMENKQEECLVLARVSHFLYDIATSHCSIRE